MKIKEIIKNIFDDFESALFPEFTCVLCNHEVQDVKSHLCEECKKVLPKIKGENLCLKCGAPINLQTKYCDDCRFMHFDFDEARACFEYNDVTRKTILGIKYNNKKYLAKFLAMQMYDKICNWGVLIDLVIPVPTTKQRLKIRGYNQSELIAIELSKLLNVEMNKSIVSRVSEGNIIAQQSLTRKERMENMKGVFKITDRHSLRGKNVLIVDDVFTTGATTNELSRTLRSVRPDKIYVITAGKRLFKRQEKTQIN